MIAPATRPRSLRIWGGLSLLLFIACAKKGADPDEKPADEKTVAEVSATTVIATSGPFTESITAVGTVSAPASSTGEVTSPIAARITKVMAVTGQNVKAGDAVVTLDRFALDAALQPARATLLSAEAAFQRAQLLVQQGIAPRKDLEAAENDLEQAKANMSLAEHAASFAVLRSPIAGVVTKVTATAGGMADPGIALIEIADPAGAEILFTVSPADAGRLHSGSSVTLRASSADTESIGTAIIREFSGMVDSATRGVQIRAQPGKVDRPLRIGETLQGDIVVSRVAKAVSIPIEALVPLDEGFQVFVVDSANIAHATKVTVGGRTATMAHILSGVKAGDRVVTTGAFGMDDGAKVVTKEAEKS